MRLRNNPKALENLKAHSDIVYVNPTDTAGKWHEVFNNDHPIFIEIGMGKGYFIIENAIRYPNRNFIGIEKYPTVLEKALKKYLKGERLDNLLFIKADAVNLNEVFAEDEVDTLYLNFSDPWPKSKHEKRRLTYRSFIDIYKFILKKDGHIIFKTDNRSLFEYTLVSSSTYGLHFNDVCLDLHNSEGYEDNIQTEYERKFSPFGPIYRIDVDMAPWKNSNIKP